MRERRPYGFFASIFLMMFFLPMVSHAKNEISIKKEELIQRTGFIENKGQIIDQYNKPNPSVLYLLNTPGMKVQLRNGGFSYDLYRRSNFEFLSHLHGAMDSIQESTKPLYNFHRIDFDLVGSNPACKIIASGLSSDYLNYYTTGTPVEGIANVRSFQTVTYKNIYPGIDLEFLTDGEHGVKYNFVVNPGGKLSSIRMKIMGPEIDITSTGSLKLTTTIGTVEEEIPHSFYRLNDRTADVHCRFYQIRQGIYGFSADQRFPENSTLLIDPVPQRLWSTYYGGNDVDFAVSMSLDPNGNIIITGQTVSVNNIATSGSFQTIYAGNVDGYFAKFNPAGLLLFGTYFGGSGNDGSKYCCISEDGSIYLAGTTNSSFNIATPGSFQQFKSDTTDAFLVKFTSAGQRIWGSYYGGSNIESGICCCVSGTSLYFCGTTNSPNNIATINSFQPSFSGMQDAFLVKFDTSGSRVWGTYYGGSSVEAGSSCRIVNDTMLFLAGSTMSSSNISTPGSHQPGFSGLADAFLVRFDTSGQRRWGTYYGGLQYEGNSCIVSDKYNRLYLSGSTASLNNMATPGSFQPSLAGSDDGYLAKFNIEGQRIWATYYGGLQDDLIYNLACDDSAYVFITGATSSILNIATPNSFQPNKSGSNDAYLAKFDSTGQRIWATFYGSDGSESGTAVETLGDTQYLLGYTGSLNSISTPNGWQPVYGGGGTDGFLVKFEDCTKPDGAQAIAGPTDVCNNNTVQYNVPIVNYSNSYIWNLPPGATISSGMNSNMIGVDFSSSAVSGILSVRGLNPCGTGDSSLLHITVHQRPLPVITGNDLSCIQLTENYLTDTGKSNYQWTFSSGGQQISGGTVFDDFIQIKWISSGNQWVDVNYTDINSCSASVPTHYPVDVAAGTLVNVNISESQNNVCPGISVTFTATPVNPGTTPVYQWKVNGVDAGSNTPTFNYVPANGDIVNCILTSSNTVCTSNNPATSNTISMVVNQLEPVSVSVSPSLNPVCAGTAVNFIAVPINGGTTPQYQWKVNGLIAGTNSPNYSYVPVNGDAVTCTLTSNVLCPSGNPALSPPVTMTVTPNPAVSVSITPPANPFCPGSQVTFIAVPNHGGLFPLYLWKVNGSNAGTNSSSFTYIPINGDVVTCELTSSDNCVTGNPATSAPVTMTASPILAVSVTIAVSSNPFCAGSSVTFTATPNHGGLVPGYQWKVNGSNAGTNSASFSYSPANGDQVSCVLNSSASCITGNPAMSNIITMTVNTNLPAGVSISTPTNPFCPGTAVTFTGNPTNGGGSPSYQWKLNGVNAGSNSTTFTCYPAVGDSIRCVITSNLNCVTGNPASSGKIIMSGNPVPLVSFTTCFDTVTILNAKPFNLYGGLPLGGQYSGPGVNSITGTFTPSIAGTGLKTITYGYSNVFTCLATKTKTILVHPNPAFTCGSNLTDIRDNKVYPTVQIGSQCWMSVNLNYGTTLNSSQVQNDNCLSEKYCFNDITGNCTKYGGLYQWDEVMKYDDSPAGQGLCPPGWHVPTEAEWTTLFNFYLGNGLAGKPLQDTIMAGFRAQTSGVYYLNSTWSFNGFATLFWTSTAWNAVKAISHGMNVYDFSVSLYPSSRANAFPVRCLRD